VQNNNLGGFKMLLKNDDNPNYIHDKHFTIKCPYCLKITGLSAISTPRYELLKRYHPPKVGIAYKCDACLEPIFLKFKAEYDFGNLKVTISEKFETVENAIEEYEYEYLPEEVQSDFREALKCFSYGCFNAFAAMCRRTVQSMASELGAKGKDKVKMQIIELKEMNAIDEESFDLLLQIIIDGHDGAHPHLPNVSLERAQILLELMKDVLYQIFIRKAKLEKAAKLRNQQINQIKQ
jgi:hypothetical protein